MRAIGIVRRMDELGRIVIPIELRRSFGITEGDPIEIYTGKQDETKTSKIMIYDGQSSYRNGKCPISGN